MNNSSHRAFEERRGWVSNIVSDLKQEYSNIIQILSIDGSRFSALSQEQKESFSFHYEKYQSRKRELEIMISSPLFRRLHLKFDDKTEPEFVCIGKFSSLSHGIYSWYAPISVLRDAVPGTFSYTRPNGQVRTGELFEREDFHMVGGEISHYAKVFSDTHREVIYDKFIESKKSDEFALPEIIEELEQIQNTIIEHDPRESIIITGPAGSGKTTLALHKLAYTLLNPDSSDWYNARACLVVVSDDSAVEYFKSLLVSLGVPDVRVVSIFGYVRSLLGFDTDIQCTADILSYKDLLVEIYKAELFGTTTKPKQPKNAVITRGDCELLLHGSITKHGKLMESYMTVVRKNGFGEYVKRLQPSTIDILVVDEFQNYHPYVLEGIIHAAKTTILSGAENQKLFPHSIGRYGIAGLHTYTLPASYRNKQALLEFLSECGFDVGESKQLGGKVEVISDYHQYVESLAGDESVAVIGITIPDSRLEHVYCHNPITVQGLQFTTSLVLIDEFISEMQKARGNEIATRILVDALYVALTRSTDNLILVSKLSQHEIAQEIVKFLK
jgi:energy-coupling factor transporter ATP-binding protein EcfA2